MKGYAGLADALVAEGTEVLFGLMGDANMELVIDLVQRHGVRFVPVRHEQNAVLAADGYSRATGLPGVATVTQGPGLSHTGTALTLARHARSQVVLVAGDTPVGDRLHVQSFDQASFAVATAGAFQPVRLPSTLAEDVRLAFRHVRLGRGPIVLNVPLDYQEGELPGQFSYVPSTATLPEPGLRVPDPARVEAAARVLGSSARPVVLAGRGAIPAEGALVALADRLGAPVATSLGGKGLFADHPRALGVIGGFATDSTRTVMAEADCVLAFGAGLNQFTADRNRLFPQAQVVQVVTDADVVGAVTPVDEAVLADARLTAEALLGITPQRARPWCGERIHAEEPFAGEDLVDDANGLDPRAVLLACNRLLPPNRAAVIGIGHFGGWFGQHLTVTEPGSLFTPWEFGSIGVGVGIGIGVSVARPDRPTVVFEGDGSLMQVLGELDTAVRCNLPLLIVLMDDAAYGAEIHKLRRKGLPTDLCLFDSPDFAALARNLGLEARPVHHYRDLDHALRAPTRPTLVHVKISREVNQTVF